MKKILIIGGMLLTATASSAAQLGNLSPAERLARLQSEYAEVKAEYDATVMRNEELKEELKEELEKQKRRGGVFWVTTGVGAAATATTWSMAGSKNKKIKEADAELTGLNARLKERDRLRKEEELRKKKEEEERLKREAERKKVEEEDSDPVEEINDGIEIKYDSNEVIVTKDGLSNSYLLYEKDGDFLIVRDDKFAGVLDMEGNWVIDLKYDTINRSGNFYKVKKGSKKGLFNINQRKWELQVQYKNIMIDGNIITVNKGNKEGLYNINQGWILKPSFDSLEIVEEEVIARKGAKEGLYNLNKEKWVLKTEYDSITSVSYRDECFWQLMKGKKKKYMMCGDDKVFDPPLPI